VPDRTNVNVRLRPLKLALCHMNTFPMIRKVVDPANRFGLAL